MYSELGRRDVTHGFLIVKSYNKLYSDYVGRYQLKHDIYAVPRTDKTADDVAVRYCGIDRDALNDYERSDLKAEVEMARLFEEGKCVEGVLFADSDAMRVFNLLPAPEQYEVIWVRLSDCAQQAPDGFTSAGFEATYFLGDHFSASCDCMLIPRWHGTDEEGTLFLEHFKRLNNCGLFDSAIEASDFLQYYLSFDWTETGEYAVAEVFVRDKAR